jgi:hypothetical protein
MSQLLLDTHFGFVILTAHSKALEVITFLQQTAHKPQQKRTDSFYCGSYLQKLQTAVREIHFSKGSVWFENFKNPF